MIGELLEGGLSRARQGRGRRHHARSHLGGADEVSRSRDRQDLTSPSQLDRWTGPLVESNVEVWDEIGTALDKNKVGVAAAALRRHLEYVSRHLADQLGAAVVFRGDGDYELNDLLPPVLARFKTICAKAADAA